jgi:hypothetical protein
VSDTGAAAFTDNVYNEIVRVRRDLENVVIPELNTLAAALTALSAVVASDQAATAAALQAILAAVTEQSGTPSEISLVPQPPPHHN